LIIDNYRQTCQIDQSYGHYDSLSAQNDQSGYVNHNSPERNHNDYSNDHASSEVLNLDHAYQPDELYQNNQYIRTEGLSENFDDSSETSHGTDFDAH